jgi:hypothetical protein
MRALLTALALTAAISGPASPNGILRAHQVDSKDANLRGFVITLALGDVESGKSAGAFTPAATKALGDLKGFLPYKSYRLLDTVWVIGPNGPHQYLHDADGSSHEFYMEPLLTENGIKIRMLRLWDGAGKGSTMSGPPLLIDTSLDMKVGETVVVGTSRLDSSHGLLLLVTAAPK